MFVYEIKEEENGMYGCVNVSIMWQLDMALCTLYLRSYLRFSGDAVQNYLSGYGCVLLYLILSVFIARENCN